MNQNEMTIKIPTPDGPISQKKRSALPLIIISVLLSIVILTAAITAGVLFLPIIKSDQWSNTADRVFFDSAELAVFTEALTDGSQTKVSLTLDSELTGLLNDLSVKLTAAGKNECGEVTLSIGGGSSELLLSMIYSEESIAMAVYDPALKADGVKYLSLPRKGLADEFKDSLFAPGSGSDYALDEAVFNEVLAILESVEGADREPDSENLQESFDNIREKLAQIIEPNVDISFAEGKFALSQTVSVRITKDDLAEMIDAVIAEAEANEELAEWLESLLGQAIGEGNDIIGTLRSAKDELPEGEVILEWTTEGSYIKHFRFAGGDTTDEFEVILDFVYGKESNLAELTVTESGKEAAKITYERTESHGELTCTLSIDINGETVESKVIYYRESGELTVSAKGSDSPESYFELSGNCKYNSAGGELSLSFDSLRMGADQKIDGFDFTVEVSKREDEIVQPNATPLLDMTGEELTAFIEALPYQSFENLVTKLLGEGSLDQYMSADGKFMFNTSQYTEAVNLYANLYSVYLANPEPIRADFIYVELPDIYLLLEYDSQQKMIFYNFAYTMTEELAGRYHPAVIGSDGELKVHNISSTYTAPTCLEAGVTYYLCDICEDTARVGEPQLPHQYVETLITVTADDGSRHDGIYSSCASCKIISSFEIRGQLGLSFSYDNSDGSYALTRYDVYGYINTCYGIPEELAKLMVIDDIKSADLKDMVSARLPHGMKVLSKGDFYNTESLQVLILPNTLTEIAEGAISSADRLHTVFFIGTADEFAKIKLGDLAGIINNVNVIYAPDGVTPDMIKKELYDVEKVNSALSSAKDKAKKNIDAAKAATKADGVTLLYSGKVENIVCDEVSGRIGIWYADSKSGSTVTIYNAGTGSVERELKVNGKITHLDIREGYAAYTVDGSFDVFVYDIAADKTVSFTALRYYEFNKDSLCFVYIHGGKVYTSTSVQHCYITYYDIATGKVDRFEWTVYTPDFYINHEQNKLVSLCLEQSPEAVVVYDLTTNTQLCEFHLDKLAFDATFMGDYVIDNRGNVYDLGGNLLPSVPAASSVRAPHSKDFMTVECLYQDKNGCLYITVDGDYNISSLLSSTATGKSVSLGVYAEVAISTADGDFLVYTPGGYGLLYVDVN